MSKAKKLWARRRRRLLLEVLGNECAQLGADCHGKLTVDCIVPQGDAHHRMDTSARQSFYHRQLKEKNLQLLCEAHQAQKSRQEVNQDPF